MRNAVGRIALNLLFVTALIFDLAMGLLVLAVAYTS